MTSSNGNISALLAICAGISPVPGEFPSQRPVTRSFDVFFDLHLNKPLSNQSWSWWFEMPSRQFWRHCNVVTQQWHVSTVLSAHDCESLNMNKSTQGGTNLTFLGNWNLDSIWNKWYVCAHLTAKVMTLGFTIVSARWNGWILPAKYRLYARLNQITIAIDEDMSPNRRHAVV